MGDSSVVLREVVEKFGMSFEDYLDRMDDSYKDKWLMRLKNLSLPSEVLNKYPIEESNVDINIVVFSAEWCPDSRFATPIAYELSKRYPRVNFFVVDREDGWDALEYFKTNGDKKVPTIIFTNSLFEEVGRWVENSALSYYLSYKVKKEMSNKPKEEYIEKLRNTFSSRKEDLVLETANEMLSLIVKTIILANKKEQK